MHGAADISTGVKRIGNVIYLGGCAGRSPQMAFKVDKIFTEDEALAVIARAVKLYKDKACPKQRLVHLIGASGIESFLKKMGLE